MTENPNDLGRAERKALVRALVALLVTLGLLALLGLILAALGEVI